MEQTGLGYVYANQEEAERRVNELRGSLADLVETLENLNESIDSLKLAQVVASAKFKLGI